MADRDFLLPDLGEGLTEGEIVSWLVAVGDAVAVDQPVAEVETAKAVVEVPSPFAGTVVKLHGGEGESLDVGAPLINVDTAGGWGRPRRRRPAAPVVAAAPEPEPGASGHPGRAGGAPAGPPAPDRRPRPQRQRPRHHRPGPAPPSARGPPRRCAATPRTAGST